MRSGSWTSSAALMAAVWTLVFKRAQGGHRAEDISRCCKTAVVSRCRNKYVTRCHETLLHMAAVLGGNGSIRQNGVLFYSWIILLVGGERVDCKLWQVSEMVLCNPCQAAYDSSHICLLLSTVTVLYSGLFILHFYIHQWRTIGTKDTVQNSGQALKIPSWSLFAAKMSNSCRSCTWGKGMKEEIPFIFSGHLISACICFSCFLVCQEKPYPFWFEFYNPKSHINTPKR